MDSELDQHLADLGWSLWTELGAPGVVRRHQNTAVDLEPLVLLTPWLARSDARLALEAQRWCRAHGRWLSQSRLKALRKATRLEAVPGLDDFLDGLSMPLENSAPTLRLDRPALIQLRLRALSGVGARADVLGQLLAHEGQHVTASTLSWLGYSKRGIAAILAELDDGQLAHSRRDGNHVGYTLAHPQQLAALVGSNGLQWVDWRRVFVFLYEVDWLLQQRSRPAPLRRVAAAKAIEILESLSDRLGLMRPPPVAGLPEAWERLAAWGLAQAQTLCKDDA